MFYSFVNSYVFMLIIDQYCKIMICRNFLLRCWNRRWGPSSASAEELAHQSFQVVGSYLGEIRFVGSQYAATYPRDSKSRVYFVEGWHKFDLRWRPACCFWSVVERDSWSRVAIVATIVETVLQSESPGSELADLGVYMDNFFVSWYPFSMVHLG